MAAEKNDGNQVRAIRHVADTHETWGSQRPFSDLGVARTIVSAVELIRVGTFLGGRTSRIPRSQLACHLTEYVHEE